MPAPKTASLFEMEYFEILRIAARKFATGETFFEVPFGKAKDAKHTQLRFYSFRSALRKDAKLHPQKQMRDQRADEYEQAARLRTRILPDGNGAILRFELAAVSEAPQIMELAAGLASVEADIEDVLDELSTEKGDENRPEELEGLSSAPDDLDDLFNMN